MTIGGVVRAQGRDAVGVAGAYAAIPATCAAVAASSSTTPRIRRQPGASAAVVSTATAPRRPASTPAAPAGTPGPAANTRHPPSASPASPRPARRTLQADRDDVLRPDPRRHQASASWFDAASSSAYVHLRRPSHQRHGFRRRAACRSNISASVPSRNRRRGRVELLHQPPPLRRRENFQPVQRAPPGPPRSAPAAAPAAPPCAPPTHDEKIGAVLQLPVNTAAAHLVTPLKVNVRSNFVVRIAGRSAAVDSGQFAAAIPHCSAAPASSGTTAAGRTRAADRDLHQTLERHVLMRIRLQAGRAGPPEQFARTWDCRRCRCAAPAC